HAGRGPYVAVAHEDWLGVDGDVGMQPPERIRRGPVRGRAAPREQTGPREQEGARAHGRDARGARCGASDPRHEVRVLARLPGARSAGDDQRVDRRRRVPQRALRDDRKPTRAAQLLTVAAERAKAVAARAVRPGAQDPLSAAEDLERAGDIEALHAPIEHEHDLSRRAANLADTLLHASIMTASALVRKDRYPTFSATRAHQGRGLTWARGARAAGSHLRARRSDHRLRRASGGWPA